MSLQISNYNPERQHLVVTQDNALNVAEGSVTESFGLGLAAKVTQGMGLSKVDNVLLEKNTKQVNLLNSKLAQALVNLTPANLDEVVSLTKHVNQIGKTAHIGCSVCGVDLVRSDVLHNYNDDLEQMNGISSRYLAIFEKLINLHAGHIEICDIVQWIVKRDEILPLDVKLFANRQDFVKGLRNIAADSHNIPLENWIVTLIQIDEQKIGEYDQHKAARKNSRVPDEFWPQFSKLAFGEQYHLAALIQYISGSRSLDLEVFEEDVFINRPEFRDFKNWSDDQFLTLYMEDDPRRHLYTHVSKKTAEKLKEVKKMLRTNPDVVLSKYDTLMTEAKKLSDVVLKKLLLLDSDRRISCLCDPQYYLFRLFLVFPQIYRCCALISGEEKAFQRGTIQSSWRDAYHEFSDSMRIVLDDPCLEKLRTRDQNLGNYLLKHNRVGHLLFDPTFMQNFAYQ